MKIKKENINEIKMPFRIIAAVGAMIGASGLILLAILSYSERNIFYILIGIIPFGIFIYCMGLSALTGYPPAFLYWASSKKENST